MGALRKFKKKQKTNKISLEVVNKQIYNQLPPLTKEQIESYRGELEKWFFKLGYVMLLSNENRDYTVFINHNQNTKEAVDALFECIENRGTVHDIEYMKEDDSWEIWIKINNQMVYYRLFDYMFGVIKY